MDCNRTNDRRARTPADLVALHRLRPRPGLRITPHWLTAYPEGYFRLTLAFAGPDLLFDDDPALVHESSPLFWDAGTPAQILLWAANADAHWCLSLTRWGVLRWECRSARMKHPAWLEYRTPLGCVMPVKQAFCAGVTIARGERGAGAHVRLLAGAPGGPLTVLSEAECELPAGVERPQTLLVGQGPRRFRPMKARALELLAANTAIHQIYQGQWRGQTGVSTARTNAAALACRLDERTVLAYPGVNLHSTTSNYWHHLAITDPRIRSVRFPIFTEMGTRFFGSRDHANWCGLAGRIIPAPGHGERCLSVSLPPRKDCLYIANAPVYDEERRDADLAEAVRLGAAVHRAAVSRGGLPVHVVELTNPAVALRSKTGVALICGQHSPLEQMTGFLGLPLLRELARLHAARGLAHGILDRLAVFWVPIFNIDCARRALPGCTLDGANPNRCWFKNQGPEQTGVERFFTQRRRQGLRLGLMLDGHAGGLWRNHTILADYLMPHAKVEQATRFGRPRHALPLAPADAPKPRWFEILDRHAGLREVWENGVAGAQMCRAPEWFQATFGCPAMTIECSVVSCFDPDTRRTRGFDLASFKQLGQRLAHALAAGIGLLEQGAEM